MKKTHVPILALTILYRFKKKNWYLYNYNKFQIYLDIEIYFINTLKNDNN